MNSQDDIAASVRLAMQQYFLDLDGEAPQPIYDMVLAQVEKPLIEVVLAHAQGNQTRAAELLGVAPQDCLAIEDSVTGAQSADAAGCVVLVVPNDVAVPDGPRRRHIESLAGLGVADLRDIYTEMCS